MAIQSIDGTDRPDKLGSTNSVLCRLVTTAAYEDSQGTMYTHKPNPQTISIATVASPLGAELGVFVGALIE